MTDRQFLHPIEEVSVRLTNDSPPLGFENRDVAFMLSTRFNIRMYDGDTTHSAHLDRRHLYETPGYDDFWLNRIDIFERVCLPSVLNLIPRPDAWFIAFGEMRPPYIRALFERLQRYSWIIPYHRNPNGPNDAPPLTELLAMQASTLGKTHLCSMSFDSDDSLHQQFYAMLDKTITQMRARGMGDETRCLNPLFGLVEAGGELSVYLRRTNMFQSIFESVDELGGPYRGSHDEIRTRMPLIEIITSLPMWMYHRHGNNLDPPGVIIRDRLPVPLLEQYFTPFGLTMANGIAHLPAVEIAETPGPTATQVERPYTSRDRRQTAARLRSAPYWDADQRAAAAELARTWKLPALTQWITSMSIDADELDRVLNEIESSNTRFLNAHEYVQLAQACEEDRRFGAALRLYDYAVQLAPDDRHVRASRDVLAASILSPIDMQVSLTTIGRPHDGHGDARIAVIVTESAAELEAKGTLDALHERAAGLAAAGYTAQVVQLPPAGDASGETEGEPFEIEGVTYLWLGASEPLPEETDAWRRALIRRLAKHVSCLNPGLLLTDGSMTAQIVASAVARAFGIPAER